MVGTVGLLGSVGLVAMIIGGGNSIIVPAPSWTVDPSITGDLVDGATLTLNPGTVSNGTVDWIRYFRDATQVTQYNQSTAATRTYTSASDIGYMLYVTVQATGPGGTVTKTSAVRVGVYDPVVYSTTFQGTVGARLIDQPGWSSNGAVNTGAEFLQVGTLLTSLEGSSNTGVAAVRTVGAGADVRVEPARNAGDDNNTSLRTYHVTSIDPQNYISFSVQRQGYLLESRVANSYTDHGGEAFSPTDAGTVYDIRNYWDGTTRYLEIWRKTSGASDFTEMPASITANGGKGFGPFHADLNGATKIGIRGGAWASNPNHTVSLSARVPAADTITFSVSSQVRSPDDFTKARITLTGTYTGSVNNVRIFVMKADGTLVVPWTTGSAISGNVISQTIDIPLISGETYIVFMGDPDIPTSVSSASKTALILPTVGDAVLGLNEGYIAVWAPLDPYQDIGKRIEWRTPTFGYIQPRGVPVIAPDVAMSVDGSGGTVKADLDGRIYAYNTASLTAYYLAFPTYHGETGNYIAQLAPGLTVTEVLASMSWSYNSSTGELTYTVPALTAQSLIVNITTASMPGGGLLPTITKSGTTINNAALRPLAAASIPQVADIVRNMTASAINKWNNSEGGRTDTQLPVDTPSNTWTGFIGYAGAGVQELIAYANGGRAVWINTKHTAGDAQISADAAVLAANITSPNNASELANEVWNRGFDSQFHEAMIAGLRRGYGPDAVTTHAAAVPETIYDGRDYVNRNTLVLSGRSYTSGNKIYVDQNGVGSLVLVATTTINPGTALAVGTNVTLLYGQAQSARAGKRWYGRRSKEMWALQDAEFTSRGKPPPLHVIAWQAATGFAEFLDILNFDSVYAVTDRVSGGFYWGGGVAGIDYGPYGVTSHGWTEAEKDLWYAGNTSGFISAACSSFIAGIDIVVAAAIAFGIDTAIYSLAMRGDKNAIRSNFYEISHHINLSGWPDQAAAWNSTDTYANKALVFSNPATGGDGKTYRAKLAVPANTVVSNTTYWAVFVDSNGATWDATKTAAHRDSSPRASQAAWNALYRSQAFAEDCQGHFFSRLILESGAKEIMFFDRGSAQVVSADSRTSALVLGNTWPLTYSEADTDVSGGGNTNWQFKVLKELKATLLS